LAIEVPICAKAVAIWLGFVRMKKLLGALAQAGNTADLSSRRHVTLGASGGPG
jgi:hypothetical protein